MPTWFAGRILEVGHQVRVRQKQVARGLRRFLEDDGLVVGFAADVCIAGRLQSDSGLERRDRFMPLGDECSDSQRQHRRHGQHAALQCSAAFYPRYSFNYSRREICRKKAPGCCGTMHFHERDSLRSLRRFDRARNKRVPTADTVLPVISASCA